jgi:hypothetical protein
MTMTTSQETITEVTRRSQEAITSAVQIWAESVQRFMGLVPTPDAKLPTAEEVADHAFNFAAQVLATQREFTMSMLAATKSVATSATWASPEEVKKES